LIYSVNVFATIQEPDLLIIGKDTVFIEGFPLEQLDLKYRPSVIGGCISSSCWRGYVAIWRIVDNKLFLERIIQCLGFPPEKENIIELFEKNNIPFQEKNGMIFANWCTMNFYRVSRGSFTNEVLQSRKWESERVNWENRLVLQIENGIILKNELGLGYSQKSEAENPVSETLDLPTNSTQIEKSKNE